MQSVKLIFDELQATNSKNEKQDIIKRNLGNDLFVEIMRFLLDDFCVTGLSNKKIRKELNGTFEIRHLRNVSEAIEYLKSHNTGSDNDIASIQRFIFYQPNELTDTYEGIFTKSLKLGCTSSTFNKSVPKELQIPTFSCMLAKKFEDHESKIKGDFVITQKLDGSRLIICKENGNVTSFTRTGKPYIGLNEIENEIKNLPIDNIVFDGELIADCDGTTGVIFTETIKKSRGKDLNKTGLLFNIFDMIKVDEFKAGKSIKRAIDRKKDLSDLFNSYEFRFCKEVKPLYIGSDKSKIQEWLQWALDNELEGVMVNLNKPYECKRTDSLLKVKVFNDADVLVTNILEGTGKNTGKLGAITIQFEHNGELYECNCGSGFNDEERILYYEYPELLIGKIVTVGYFEISQNSEGGYGMRFPTWKSKIRHEKTEISMN